MRSGGIPSLAGNGNHEAKNAGLNQGSHRMEPARVSMYSPAWPRKVTFTKAQDTGADRPNPDFLRGRADWAILGSWSQRASSPGRAAALVRGEPRDRRRAAHRPLQEVLGEIGDQLRRGARRGPQLRLDRRPPKRPGREPLDDPLHAPDLEKHLERGEHQACRRAGRPWSNATGRLEGARGTGSGQGQPLFL